MSTQLQMFPTRIWTATTQYSISTFSDCVLATIVEREPWMLVLAGDLVQRLGEVLDVVVGDTSDRNTAVSSKVDVVLVD